MLYNLDWLEPGSAFPPAIEVPRITRYKQNARLFDGDHFADPEFRSRNSLDMGDTPVNLYKLCAERISKVVGNFDDIISFPVLLNYQRLMTLKTADLVCGEYPSISGVTYQENAAIKDVRDITEFDAKLYATVIDISRYGDAIWRMYKNEDGRIDFTCWDPCEWFPIVTQDGTHRIKQHCLCWVVNVTEDPNNPKWELHVQIHGCDKDSIGQYEHRWYAMNHGGTQISKLIDSEFVQTGLDRCAVFNLRSFATSDSVYGYDDYMPLDSLLSEIMVRVGQISCILDKHADPNITGPTSMLSLNPDTGEYYLETGKFFATSPGEEHPEYMTWDGQLASAFKQLEFLINQLYILSEMGAAFLGAGDGGGQAISGTAFRYKMANPLARVRRIANSLSVPVRKLFSSLSVSAEVDEDILQVDEDGAKSQPLQLPIPYRRISVFWSDGLPDDPRENVEIAKLASGEERMMPLEVAIMEYFGRSNEEAREWIQMLEEEARKRAELQVAATEDVNHSGPQDGTGVNPRKKGSVTGLNDFHGLNNQ